MVLGSIVAPPLPATRVGQKLIYLLAQLIHNIFLDVVLTLSFY